MTHDGRGRARRPLEIAADLGELSRLLSGPCSVDELISARLRAAILLREAQGAGEAGLKRRADAVFDTAGSLIHDLVGPYEDDFRDLT